MKHKENKLLKIAIRTIFIEEWKSESEEKLKKTFLKELS